VEAAVSEVFIYCDDASHPRRTAVETFQGSGGGWVHISKPFGQKRRGRQSGSVTLDKDDNLKGSPDYRVYTNARMGRDRWRLSCRKCEDRPLEVRHEKLVPVLDKLAAQGVSEVSLTSIAAMLRVQSRSD
jgi:hypothetical protein